MYQGKRTIMRLEEYNQRRKEIISTKRGAVWNTFIELENLINKSALANQYFSKSQSWLSQKIHGCTVMDKRKEFTKEEYDKLSEALRDIAHRLEAHADEISNATVD